MQDLAGKITELLADPEIMKQIKEFSGQLADNGSNSNEKTCDQPENNRSNEKPKDFSLPPEVLQSVLKLGPVLSSLKQEDKYTRFLKALRPLLSKKKQQKLDSSSQILQIIKILPLLKNNGLL